jgi:hypothetical protein
LILALKNLYLAAEGERLSLGLGLVAGLVAVTSSQKPTSEYSSAESVGQAL